MTPTISFRESPPSRLVYWMPRNSMLQSHIQACPLFSVAQSDSHWCHKPGISLPHQRSFSTIVESSLCHPPLLRQNPPAYFPNEIYTERFFLINRKLLLYSETKAKRWLCFYCILHTVAISQSLLMPVSDLRSDLLYLPNHMKYEPSRQVHLLPLIVHLSSDDVSK